MSFLSAPTTFSTDVRIEEFLYEKLDKKVPTRVNNHELLGQSMIDSGNEFGPGTAYGNHDDMHYMIFMSSSMKHIDCILYVHPFNILCTEY